LIDRLATAVTSAASFTPVCEGLLKTVLLMELGVLATEAGWATTDVQEVGSQPDFRVAFARMAMRLLREMSQRHRLKDRVERALRVVKAFSIAVPGAVHLKLDVEAASGIADSAGCRRDWGAADTRGGRRCPSSVATDPASRFLIGNALSPILARELALATTLRFKELLRDTVAPGWVSTTHCVLGEPSAARSSAMSDHSVATARTVELGSRAEKP
jgi:hypothetical protein